MSKARDDNAIGRRIQQRRLELGLSQQELAEKLDLSYQQVQNYENGTSDLTIRRLREVALHLKAPLDFFLKGVQSPRGGRLSQKQPSRETRKEKRLLRLYRKLEDPSAQAAVLKMAQALDHQLSKRRTGSSASKKRTR